MKYLDKFKLVNKKVIVLGGNGLIGSEISNAMLEAGGNVTILDLDSRVSRLKSKNLNYIKFNIEENNYHKKFMNLIKNKFTPDIFINCTYPYDKHWNKNNFMDISFESFKKNIDLHLVSYSWLAKETADVMLKKKILGSIIQLGSIYGILGQDLGVYKGTKMKENMSYSIIKGGIHNLTRQMASYYGKYSIRINTLCPGGVLGNVSGKKKEQSKSFINNYSNKVPLRRLANSNEVASAALFLASDASSYITGSTLIVDGGWSII